VASAESHQAALPFWLWTFLYNFLLLDLRITGTPASGLTHASVRITNTGDRAGTEVAGLYVGFPPIPEGNEAFHQLKGIVKTYCNLANRRSCLSI
jgi:hypothetical protein